MKKLFFLPALAALFFASCSSDEPGGPASPETPQGDRYIAVAIRTAGMGGSKALPVDDDFENPETENESKLDAENVRFYFFTEDGRPFTLVSEKVNGVVEKTNMVKPTVIKYTSNALGNETVAEGVLVLGKPDVPYVGTTPAQVLCVANAKDVVSYDDFANQTLAQIQKIVANRPSDLTRPTFTMVSSTYAENSKEVFTAPITATYSTVEEAEKNPVHIYIERLAAKVRMSNLGTSKVLAKDASGATSEKEFTITTAIEANGSETKITTKLDVELVGWQLYKKPSSCLAIKDIESAITTSPFTDWNDPTRHRSYWSVTGATQYYNESYDLYADNQFVLGNKTDATNNKEYVYEHTLVQPESVTDRSTNATAIVVKAVIKKAGETDGYDFCMWAGQLYSSAAMKQLVFNAYKAGHPNTNHTVDEVEFTTAGSNANTWKATVANDPTDFDNISYWKNGVTSYWLNIEHMGGKFGVVRNHIYDYTIEKVIGLGVPGKDPENPDPETESYIAARLYVLNWLVVKHDVTLE